MSLEIVPLTAGLDMRGLAASYVSSSHSALQINVHFSTYNNNYLHELYNTCCVDCWTGYAGSGVELQNFTT